MKNLYTDAILRLCNPALAERKFSTFATQFIHKNKILSSYSFRRVPIYGLNIKFHQKDAYSPTAIYDGKVADDFIRPNEKLTKKFILVSGGVISGIGKGVTASSVGVVLKMLNIPITAIKIDPYLNVDAGTMSPFEHGECFVLDDGAETDLDLGNYERFMDIRLTNDSNLTTGKIYQAVIAKERRGEFLGKTVQIIPHITNEIIERIISVASQPVCGVAVDSNNSAQHEPDVCVIELGGTIGDIESMPFVEALRQLQLRVKPENFCIVHVSMVPIVGSDGEQKTKPTQHSVKELRGLGLSPDFIVCRSTRPVEASSREKIALFCNVPVENVLSVPDVPNIFHVPLLLLRQQFHSLLAKRLGLPPMQSGDSESADYALNGAFKREWEQLVETVDSADDEVVVALVGKYTNQQDSYLSVISSLKHSCIATKQRLKLLMVDSSLLEDDSTHANQAEREHAWQQLRSAHAILVPGGFGVRGIEGKVKAITFARESGIPFLGVCLGMQAAVIEYCRAFLNKPLANSKEFSPEISEGDSAIIFMPEVSRENMGGTMRLGARKTLLEEGTLAMDIYNNELLDGERKQHSSKNSIISERHRHRYEVNPDFVAPLEAVGLRFRNKFDAFVSGRDLESKQRMEIVELSPDTHPYFVAVQFHPEFQSRPLRPAPVVLGLLQAALKHKQKIRNASNP